MTEEQARQCAADKSRLIAGAVYRVAKLPTGEWYVYRGLPGIGINSPIASFQDGKELNPRSSYSGTQRVAQVSEEITKKNGRAR